jgi:hypothetical protein
VYDEGDVVLEVLDDLDAEAILTLGKLLVATWIGAVQNLLDVRAGHK